MPSHSARPFARELLCAFILTVVATASHSQTKRTKAQVDALIQKEGKTKPDWWDAVPLSYPETLDLTWQRSNGLHDYERNTSLYFWWVVCPNPGRWKAGVKTLHHMLAVNAGDRVGLQKTMAMLGHLYHDLLQDYARAAFWWRKVSAKEAPEVPVRLARCYWKLGSRDMAVSALERLGPDSTAEGAVIRLWADLGELPKAIALATERAKTAPEVAYLAAGDACRQCGQYDRSMSYYRKVLRVPEKPPNQHSIRTNRERAEASLAAVKALVGLDLERVPNGTYRGSSTAYAGTLEVAVTVKARRLLEVKVTKHKEKQFFAALTDTPRQIVEKQGIAGVDGVSGATMTSEAILNATAKALAGATQ